MPLNLRHGAAFVIDAPIASSGQVIFGSSCSIAERGISQMSFQPQNAESTSS